MNYLRPAIFGLAALTALLVAGEAQPAHAATFTVNSTGDALANDGVCTLREAITAANTDTASGAMVGECAAGSGPDTINLPAGTYSLSIAGANEDANASGDLDITDALTINGAGAATTIIDGGALDRVFHIFGGSTVEISGVTIQNGSISGGGGGIWNLGMLTLTNSTVSGNTSDLVGGGILNDLGTATLTLTASTVSGNMATDFGAGILNFEGTATLTDSTVSGNSAGDSGGGIDNFAGTLTLNSSTVSGNTAVGGGGGGIGNFGGGTATITSSTVSGNTGGSGGGINNTGTLTLDSSTVGGNTGDFFGGGIFNADGGTLTLTGSTVSGNTAAGGSGGGIFNGFVSTATLTSSTVSGNTAAGEGGGISGGGIRNALGSTATLKNAIVANSTASSDCSGTITSDGYNLDSDGTCGLGSTGDLPSTDPLLGSLTDNGGPTETHALLVGSPAIDVGSGDCPPPTIDQRGVSRPLDGNASGSAICDIGSFEYNCASQADIDSDGIGAACDNCPAWPNAGQSLPPWPVTLDGSDPDCDGTTTALEDYVGTDPNLACGINAWPPDTTDNGTVNAGDFGIIVDSWQKSSGYDGYIQRADLNGNGTVNAGDLGPIAETWQQSCT